MSAQSVDRAGLLKVLTEYFTEEDLNTLCFELNIDYDSLDGESKTGKARELIRYCENRGRLPDLVNSIRTARPTLQLPIDTPVSAPAVSAATTPTSYEGPAQPGKRNLLKALIAGGGLIAFAAMAFAAGQVILNPDRGDGSGAAAPTATAESTATLADVTATEQAATPAATQTNTSSSDELLIDDFEQWTDPLPADVFVVNRGGGNDAQVSVTDDSAHVGQGQRALAFSYTIFNADTDPARNYVGFDRVFPPQDWSGYSQFCAWVEPDDETHWMSFIVSSGHPNAHDKLVKLEPGGHEYCVPLRPTLNNADLTAVTSYQFYLGAPFTQQGGTIYIDDVRLVP